MTRYEILSLFSGVLLGTVLTNLWWNNYVSKALGRS